MAAPASQPSKIRFGCCGSMISPGNDPVGIEIVEDLASLGFDYIELSMRDLVALPETLLAALGDRLQHTGLACEACNNFFPPEIRLTGPTADLPSALRYTQAAFAIAGRLGVSAVIFGSAGSRNVPPGFSHERAWNQLRDFLTSLGPIAKQHNVTIGIEHLNRGESNILNTVAETSRMAQEVGHSHIRLLVDAYHLRQEHEEPAILAEIAPLLAHVHIAQGADRLFPTGGDATLANFFVRLRDTGYAQRCSIEAYTHDFRTDAAHALRVCRELASGFTDVEP
jgi:D-psicose/D-tagatose/L-ribulose 3-epimerase